MRLIGNSMLIALLFCLTAIAQTAPPTSTSGSTEQVVTQNSAPQQSTISATAQTSGPVTGHDGAVTRLPIIITVIDTSGTVRRALPQLKQVARDILAAAPDASRFGVISVNTEAQKKMFAQRVDAIAYIDTLKAARNGFTDLNRATDAALTLIQGEGESRPTVIAYLTDGKLEVPDSFKDKSDFVTILGREFTPRSNIRVVVVSVNGGELPKGAQTLPQNVTFFPMTNWTMAQTEVAKTLVPQIREQLTATRAPAEPVKATPATAAPSSVLRPRLVMVAAGLLILLLAGGAFLAQQSRRRKRNEAEAAQALSEYGGPENLLTEADLQAAPPEPAPAQVALLEIERAAQHGLSDDLPAGRQRIKMEVGERVVIGNTAIAADLHFAELKQTQTLELRLEKDSTGLVLKAYRLRPDAPGALDPVSVNGQKAPMIFTLKHGDKFMVGPVGFRIVYADYRLLELLDGVGDIAPVDAALIDTEPTQPALRDEPPFAQTQLPPLFTPGEHVSLRRRYGS